MWILYYEQKSLKIQLWLVNPPAPLWISMVPKTDTSKVMQNLEL